MITLNTILYESNYADVLKKDSWFFTFTSELISKRILTINNLTSTKKFNDMVGEMKKYYEFDLIFVSESKDNVKKQFDLDIDENTIGYYYTIPYFVALSNTTTEFFLNVAADCMMDINVDDDFLSKSMNELNTNPLCSTTMISWVKDNHVMNDGLTVGGSEHNKFNISDYNDDFDYSFGFTDQFFMGRLDLLKSIDYNIEEKFANTVYNGPEYGGYSFEKRMAANQVLNIKYNCIFKGAQYYIHDNNYY